MQTLLLFSHSYFKDSKINKALLDEANKIENVKIHNLNSVYPNGKIDINAEIALLEQSDRIIVQFPLFWYSCPSIFKEWQDEVLTALYSRSASQKALKGKKIGFVITLGAQTGDLLDSSEILSKANGEKLNDVQSCLFSITKSFETIGANPQIPFSIFDTHESGFKLPVKEYLDYIKTF